MYPKASTSNIPFAYIHDVNELYNLLKIAFDNPRRIRNKDMGWY